jgi:hypothetical protein
MDTLPTPIGREAEAEAVGRALIQADGGTVGHVVIVIATAHCEEAIGVCYLSEAATALAHTHLGPYPLPVWRVDRIAVSLLEEYRSVARHRHHRKVVGVCL